MRRRSLGRGKFKVVCDDGGRVLLAIGVLRGFDMATVKQEVEQLLQRLPDDSTLEDIQYHLYVLEIKHGRQDIAAARRYTVAQARERLGRWLRT
jgi:hypothetical protein